MWLIAVLCCLFVLACLSIIIVEDGWIHGWMDRVYNMVAIGSIPFKQVCNGRIETKSTKQSVFQIELEVSAQATSRHNLRRSTSLYQLALGRGLFARSTNEREREKDRSIDC